MYNIVRSKRSKIIPMLKYDAFFSFNEDNDELRYWILNVLVRQLESVEYDFLFLTGIYWLDLLAGFPKEELPLEYILKSQNSLVILCKHYKHGSTTWTKLEWKYIWHNFLDKLDRNVIVINFDQIDTAEDMDQRLRAFLRLEYDIDFSNRNHDLVSKNNLRLGRPLIPQVQKKDSKAVLFHRRFNSNNLNEKQSPFDVIHGSMNSSCTL